MTVLTSDANHRSWTPVLLDQLAVNQRYDPFLRVDNLLGWLTKLKKALQYYLLLGRLSGSAVEHLPSAQDMILGPGIKSCIGLPAWSLLLPLRMSLPLSLSLINK